MNQKAQYRLLVLVSCALILALGALVGARSSASLQGRKRSAAAESLPNFDGEALLLSAMLILLAGLLYWAFGRKRKAAFNEPLWHAAPEPNLQPAVLGRLLRNNAFDADDITVTLLYLAQRKCVRVTPGMHPDATGIPAQDYLLERLTPEDPADPVERATLNLMFDLAEPGSRSVWLSDIHRYGRNHFNEFTQAVASWQKTLTLEVKSLGLFDRASTSLRLATMIASLALLISGGLLFLATSSLIPLVSLALTALAYGLLSRHMGRLSQRGTEILARTEALHSWLLQLSETDAKKLTAQEWAELAPYAFVLGAASEAIDVLSELAPCLLRTPHAHQENGESEHEGYALNNDGSDGGCGNRESEGEPENKLAPWVLWYSETQAEQAGATHFARAASSCIAGTAFAAAATDASARMRALNNPVQGALSGGGIPDVGGMGAGATPHVAKMR